MINELINDIIKDCRKIKDEFGYFMTYDSKRPNIHTRGLLKNFGIIELQSLILDDHDKPFEILDFVTESIKNGTLTNIKNNDMIHHEKYGNLVFKLLTDEFGLPIYRVITVEDFMTDPRVFTEEDKDNNERILNY